MIILKKQTVYKYLILSTRVSTILTELPINVAQLYYMTEFLKLKMNQRRLTLCEMFTSSLILSIVFLNVLNTLLFNLYQAMHYESVNLYHRNYYIWKNVAEISEDIIVLVNGIGFLYICLKVYQGK